MERLLGILDLLQGRHNSSHRIEGFEVYDDGVGLCNCAIFNGSLACEGFLLSRSVLGLLPGGRVKFLLYGLLISDVKDLHIPLAHGGLERAKLLMMSRPHAHNMIGCGRLEVIRSLQDGAK